MKQLRHDCIHRRLIQFRLSMQGRESSVKDGKPWRTLPRQMPAPGTAQGSGERLPCVFFDICNKCDREKFLLVINLSRSIGTRRSPRTPFLAFKLINLIEYLPCIDSNIFRQRRPPGWCRKGLRRAGGLACDGGATAQPKEARQRSRRSAAATGVGGQADEKVERERLDYFIAGGGNMPALHGWRSCVRQHREGKAASGHPPRLAVAAAVVSSTRRQRPDCNSAYLSGSAARTLALRLSPVARRTTRMIRR